MDCLYYSRPEVCRLLDISKATLYRWVDEGFFPKQTRLRGRALWLRERVNDWVKEKESQHQVIEHSLEEAA